MSQKSTHYEQNAVATSRIFNDYDRIQRKEGTFHLLFPKIFETFFEEHYLPDVGTETMIKVGFTITLFNECVYFYMDFDNMGVDFYEAAKSFFNANDFYGNLHLDTEMYVNHHIVPKRTKEDQTKCYRFGYIRMPNTLVLPSYAFETAN